MKIIILFTCLFFFSNIYSQIIDNESKCIAEGSNNDSSTINCLSHIKTNKNIYFFGSNPDSNEYKIGLDVFKYFVKDRGFRILLLERPNALVFLLNAYLQNNNQTLIDNYIEDFKYCKKCKAIEKSFILNISNLYKSLPDSQKFVVLGIDYDRSKIGVVHVLKLIFQIQDTTLSHDELYNNLTSFINFKTFQVDAQNLLNYIQQHEQFFRHLFNRNYFQLTYILKNLTYQSNNGKYFCETNSDIERIKYQNVLDIYSSFNEKMFGIISYEHLAKTLMDEWVFTNKNIFSFVAMLNKNDKSIFKDQVCTILPLMSNNLITYYHSQRESILELLIRDKSGSNIQLYDMNKLPVFYDQESEAFDYIYSIPNNFKKIR